MPDDPGAKPSYLGLLNILAVAEGQAAEYFAAWIETTTDDRVRAALTTVQLREAEHAIAFRKRMDELGYSVREREDPDQAGRMELVRSTELSDREKLERLGLTNAPRNGEPDVFDRFFENKDLDPVTGALLGRYIAEERDTARLMAACYAALS